MTTIKRQSFAAWLGTFLRLDTPFGDIARDVYADNDFPKEAASWSPIFRHLEGTGLIELAAELFAMYEEEVLLVTINATDYDLFVEEFNFTNPMASRPAIQLSDLPIAKKLIEAGKGEQFEFHEVVIRDSLGEDVTQAFDPHGVFRTLLGLRVKKEEPWHLSQGVYFARTSSRIKIGVSNNVGQRLKSLQTGCPEPIVLIGVISGDVALEREWHTRFSNIRQKGEWFTATPELETAIQSALDAQWQEDDDDDAAWLKEIARRQALRREGNRRVIPLEEVAAKRGIKL